MQILNGYIYNFMRPLFKAQCVFVLVTKNGSQHSKLGNEMSKLVYDAIGKYIHPTNYRQIIKMQSLHVLNDKERQVLSEDQKHGLFVAKVHYQKWWSHKVAVRAHKSLQKLQGTKGSEVDMEVNNRFGSSCSTATFEPATECAWSQHARPKATATRVILSCTGDAFFSDFVASPAHQGGYTCDKFWRQIKGRANPILQETWAL